MTNRFVFYYVLKCYAIMYNKRHIYHIIIRVRWDHAACGWFNIHLKLRCLSLYLSIRRNRTLEYCDLYGRYCLNAIYRFWPFGLSKNLKLLNAPLINIQTPEHLLGPSHFAGFILSQSPETLNFQFVSWNKFSGILGLETLNLNLSTNFNYRTLVLISIIIIW